MEIANYPSVVLKNRIIPVGKTDQRLIPDWDVIEGCQAVIGAKRNMFLNFFLKKKGGVCTESFF